jgi:hypothetical protein
LARRSAELAASRRTPSNSWGQQVGTCPRGVNTNNGQIRPVRSATSAPLWQCHGGADAPFVRDTVGGMISGHIN